MSVQIITSLLLEPELQTQLNFTPGAKMNTTFNGSSSHPPIVESHDVGLIMASVSISNIVGLPLNVYVMWLILSGATGTVTSDFFSLNLAMSEIFFFLISFCYFGYIQLNCFFCLEVLMFSRGLFWTARPLFLCCICAECYAGVVHPVLFLRFKPPRYRVACGCVGWLIIVMSCLYSAYKYSNLMYLYGFFTQNLLFSFVMLYCCLSVLRALKRPGPGDEAGEKKKSNTMKKRAFKIILMITISNLLSFLLCVAAIPLQCCLNAVDFSRAFIICTSLAWTTGFTQPLLYLHRTGKLICFGDF